MYALKLVILVQPMFFVGKSVSKERSSRAAKRLQVLEARGPARFRVALLTLGAAILSVAAVTVLFVSLVQRNPTSSDASNDSGYLSYMNSKRPAILPGSQTSCRPALVPAKMGFDGIYLVQRHDTDVPPAALRNACPYVDTLVLEGFELPPSGIENAFQKELGQFSSKWWGQNEWARKRKLISFSVPGNNELGAGLFAAQITTAAPKSLRTLIRRSNIEGVCLDIRSASRAALPEQLIPPYHYFDMLKEAGVSSCLKIDTAVAAKLSAAVLNLFDQILVHGVIQDKHPSQNLQESAHIEDTLHVLKSRAPNAAIVPLLALGGYLHQNKTSPSKRIPYSEVMVSHRHQLEGMRLSKTSQAAMKVPETASSEALRVFDAASAYNVLNTLQDKGFNQFGLVEAGFEDPSLWQLMDLAADQPEKAAQTLTTVSLSDFVAYRGEGPVLHFDEPPETGRRSVSIDNDTNGALTAEYVSWPKPHLITRSGHSAGGKVALTFDDGPDPVFTAQILNILRRENVSATFFPVGSMMVENAPLLRRMVMDGHVIGSHSFYHTPLENVSAERLRLEMSIQRELQSGLTGYRPALFRAPYVRGLGPVDGRVAEKMGLIYEQGYTIVGSDIVPPDWLGSSAAQIVEHVLSGVRSGRGNVVLLHDGGGDRTETVAALPQIIRTLKAEGYEFVSVNDYIGRARAGMFPEVPEWEALPSALVTSTLFSASQALDSFLLLVVAMGVCRLSVLLFFSKKRGRKQEISPMFRPHVTVIVPAYNEERVIVRTVNSILQSNYQRLHVLVVDDGSTDRTYEVVQSAFSSENRVSLVYQENGGKWQAANTAIRTSQTDIVVAIDADTLVDPDAVWHLVQRFADPKVGAVAGNVMIGNRTNLLTRLQMIEYVTAQNIERRAFEHFNGMLVVPGAIGAWRSEAIKEAGFYSYQTLTEDSDLTVSVIRSGYKVVYEERAYTYTEAPETIKAFLAQRLRWTTGMIQTAVKHRSEIGRRTTVGRWSLPDLLVFGILLPLFSPIAELFLFIGLTTFTLSMFGVDLPFTSPVSHSVLLAYLALPIFEGVLAYQAFKFEPKASNRLLFLLPLQRLFYRQLLSITVIRASWRSLTGRLSGWNKLSRTGNAELN